MLLKVVKIILGLLILPIGLILLVTPGPGIPLVLAGLYLIANQFESGRKWIDELKRRFRVLRGQKPSGQQE